MNFWNSIMSVNWLDYGIIILFMVIALFMVGYFMKPGPKKWFAFVAILFGGGLALNWTRRRHRYTEKKLREHNNQIKDLRTLVEDRNKIIEESNLKILELEQKKALLNPEIEKDKASIKEIEKKLERERLIHEQQNLMLETQEREIASQLTKIEQESPLPSSQDILSKFGLTGKRPTSSPIINDPNPPKTVNENLISISGFTMKGDTE